MSVMRSLFALMILTAAVNTQAAIAVIVHLDNYEKINEAQLRNLYLGKMKTFPSGADVNVLDLTPQNSVREAFTRQVLRRSESNLNAYWARMLFSSQGRPPPMLNTPQEVLNIVSHDKKAIAYIDLDAVDTNRVRVIMVFE